MMLINSMSTNALTANGMGIDLKQRPKATNPLRHLRMQERVLIQSPSMRLFKLSSAVLVLLANTSLAVLSEAKAGSYQCFDRQTGEQVAISNIDITTPSVSCLPNNGTTTAPNGNGDPHSDDDDLNPGPIPESNEEDGNTNSTPSTPSPSTPSPSTTTMDPLAARRAINLARGTAVSLNGGLSQYRPGACMFASTKDNPCITRADAEEIEFTIPGGSPGWEQNGDEPNVITVVVISADGRSVLESRNK